MSCLDIFFSNSLPIIGSMDIRLQLQKSLESKHGIFMMGISKMILRISEFHNYLVNKL